jgi:iron complex transport system substrate-binding protein
MVIRPVPKDIAMPDTLSSRRLSRRGLLAGGAAGLAALLAGCGRDGGDPPATSPAGGPWSFTDDRQEKVAAANRPSRIVAFTGVAAALVDFGLDKQIVGVFGETKKSDGSKEPQAGDLDVNRVEILGNAWGEFNLEKYAALRPELLVTHMYDPGALWYVPDESKSKILPLAPSVAITTARVPMTRPIERYAQLAESLGADLSASKVTAAKARFTAAADAVRQAVKANPGIRVMAASGSPDLFYVSNPKISTDLMYFVELGVDLVVPTKLEQGDYFEALSWENTGKFPADLILLDNRPTALQPKDLAAKPTWAQLPAVKAGQVTPWDAVPRFSYAGAAPLLENLATAIRGARKVTA